MRSRSKTWGNCSTTHNEPTIGADTGSGGNLICYNEETGRHKGAFYIGTLTISGVPRSGGSFSASFNGLIISVASTGKSLTVSSNQATDAAFCNLSHHHVMSAATQSPPLFSSGAIIKSHYQICASRT